LQQDV